MDEKNETGMALSGGGFRATLFHLGAIWRLNEMAMLPEIERFSAVSGGSILAGLLAVRWSHLTFDDGIAVNFSEEIFSPIWQFCSRNVDQAAAWLGLVSGTWKLEQSYRKHIVGECQLRDLPDRPEFVFNAAHIETGRNCTLTGKGLHTWRLGDIELPTLTLAKAIAASSACPPFFPAVTLDLDPSAFVETEHADLFHRDDLKGRVSLTDGGGLRQPRHPCYWGLPNNTRVRWQCATTSNSRQTSGQAVPIIGLCGRWRQQWSRPEPSGGMRSSASS